MSQDDMAAAVPTAARRVVFMAAARQGAPLHAPTATLELACGRASTCGLNEVLAPCPMKEEVHQRRGHVGSNDPKPRWACPVRVYHADANVFKKSL